MSRPCYIFVQKVITQKMFSNFRNIQYPRIQTTHIRTPHSYSVMITNDITLYKLYEFITKKIRIIYGFLPTDLSP